MKQKLLYLFIGIVFSAVSYAQQYGQPMNFSQCNNEVFNLTANAALILNGQDPSQHILSYHLTQAAAANNVNPIGDPAFVITQQGEIRTIFVRISFNGQYQIRSFSIQWDMAPQIPPTPDVFNCDLYTLPPPLAGQYYTGPNATGATLPAGTTITATTVIYIYADNGICNDEQSFTVNITPTPIVPELEDVIACGSYTLPFLNTNVNYYTGPSGTGVMISPGSVITASTTLYVFGGGGNAPIVCFSESSFNIIINVGTIPSLFVTPEAIMICPGNSVLLSAVTDQPFPVYQWYRNGLFIPGAVENTFIATPFSTESYQCKIQSDCGSVFSNTAVITVSEDLGQMFFMTSGDLCVGQSFTVAVANPNPNSTYVWTQPIGGSASVSTASSLTINSATTADSGVYICSSINDCGSIMVMTITINLETCNNNTISGFVRADADNNGCTANDAGIPNVGIAKYVGNNVVFSYTNNQGEYSFSNVQEGNCTVMLQAPLPNYNLISPAPPGTHNFNLVGTENALTGDFCLAAPQPTTDALVYMYANTGARPGFPVSYTLAVYNSGNTAISGTALFGYNPGMLDFVGSNPVNTGQDNTSLQNILTYNFSNLQPFQYAFYHVQFTVKVPPTVNSGDVLDFSFDVTVVGDTDLSSNHAELHQIVVNSYDPNDIAVRQGAQIYADQTSQYLDYTIRFQNTGTADAITVKVTNALDALLDWSTFSPVFASHNYRTERVGEMVTFTFDNINLPAESVDEVGSNGYVTYKIKPKSNVTLGDIMKAQASIYFDFNLPIITNEVSTQVVEMMGVHESAFANLKMHPNPASSKVTIDLNTDVDQAEAVVYDIQGKVILNGRNFGRSIELNLSSVTSGMYFVKIVSGAQSVVKKLLVN